MDWGGGEGWWWVFKTFLSLGRRVYLSREAVRKNKKDGIYVYSKYNIWGLPNFGVIVDVKT